MRRYGQTGSGKTYTLLGTPDQPGVVPRAFERLGEALNGDITMHVTVSMVSSDKHPHTSNFITMYHNRNSVSFLVWAD